MLQSYYIGCSLANHDTKDPIFMHKTAKHTQTIRRQTVSHQRNPEPDFKYS